VRVKENLWKSERGKGLKRDPDTGREATLRNCFSTGWAGGRGKEGRASGERKGFRIIL